MRITLGDVRASRIPKILGICATDDRIPQFVNEATQRLLTKGHWWGSYARFRICASEGCITLPPQIAALERAAVCGSPVRLRDMWYEFLENGFGLQYQIGNGSCSSGACCGGNIAPLWPGSFGIGDGFQRGTFPTYQDIRGTNKKLVVVCDLAGDVDKQALFLGYDENGNWIRTTQSGAVRDGELISMAQAAGTTSVNFFSAITDIQAPADLDGQWWLYELNTDDATLRMLGHYQYFETRPNYQRYFFPMVPSGQNSDGDGCALTTVEVIAKLDFIPVVHDTDYVVIGNMPALKEMTRAVFLSENEPDYEKAARILTSGEVLALRELDKELEHYLGERQIGVDIVGASVGYAQPIESFL